eukprot:11363539-Ditylum_brightwellii.AAC.1
MCTTAADVVNDSMMDNGLESMYNVASCGNYTNETVLLNSTNNTIGMDDTNSDMTETFIFNSTNHTMDTDLLDTTTHNGNNNNNRNHDHGTWIPISNVHVISIGSNSSNAFTGIVAAYHQPPPPPIPSLSQTTATRSTSNDSYNESSISTSWTRLGPDLH